MTAEQLANDVVVRINTVAGFADRVIENPDEALRDAELFQAFASIEPVEEKVGVIRAHILFTQGWHCANNTQYYTCHG